MQYLYTLPECPGCAKAKEILKDQEYKEISVDNPLCQFALAQIMKMPSVPLLIKEDNRAYFLADIGGGDMRFVKIP